jgi:polysaccharide deacetylase family protein (PEP-CTERM system associated)
VNLSAHLPHDKPPALPNVFTVDLEEWFQGLTSTNGRVDAWDGYESRVVYATGLLLDILRTHRVRATFFTLGHVADKHPGLIEQICAEGHEIGIHGYFHRFVTRMTPAEFDEEIGRSLEAVARASGQTPQGHRAPYFSVNATTPWVFEVLARHGLRYDSSVFPVRSLLYGYPGAPRLPYVTAQGLWEVPASTLVQGGRNWPIAGGFYVRALPYAMVRWALRRLQRAGEPAILYVHPWELDTGQRYNQVTARERLTHYHGRRGLAAKLHRLFTDFRFGPMSDLVTVLAGINTEGMTSLEGTKPVGASAAQGAIYADI